MDVKAIAKKLVADVVAAVKHPNSARKAVVAVLVPVAADLADLTHVAHLPVAVTAVVSGALVFLTSNKVVAVAQDLEK